MKIVYIAHPISGDVNGNLEKIRLIVRAVNLTFPDVVPFVPYYADCLALDDGNTDERARGIRNDREFFLQGIINEVWLFGPTISGGMHAEVALANSLNTPVYAIAKSIQNEVRQTAVNGVSLPSKFNLPAAFLTKIANL
jgi:hypothetical protein